MLKNQWKFVKMMTSFPGSFEQNVSGFDVLLENKVPHLIWLATALFQHFY